MNLWEYLAGRDDRADDRKRLRVENRVARQLLLIEKGLDWRSLTCRALTQTDPRFLVAVAIIGLFAWAFARESDKDTRNLMVGALIAAFAGAWGYYLGSSSTASRANDRADSGLQLAQETLKRLPPPPPEPEEEVEVEPGDRVTVAGRETGEAGA